MTIGGFTFEASCEGRLVFKLEGTHPPGQRDLTNLQASPPKPGASRPKKI